MFMGIMAILSALYFIRLYFQEKDKTSLFFIPLIGFAATMYYFHNQMDDRLALALTIIFIFNGIYIMYRYYDNFKREKKVFIQKRQEARRMVDQQEKEETTIIIEQASKDNKIK